MVIISSIMNYSPDDIKCLVGSLNDVGYTGTKIMLVYNNPNNVVDYLNDNGWVVVEKELTMLQHIQRFKDSHDVLLNYPDEKYLFLDSRDVFFNKNPELWDLNKPLYVGVDGFSHLANHEWGRENMLRSYPQHYSNIFDKYHLNCGAIYGEGDTMVEFLLDVYTTALESDQRIGLQPMDFTPDDQMALNVLCYTKYNGIAEIQSRDDDYIFNMAQIVWSIDHTKEFYIYHQYDRVSEFNLNTNC